MGVAWSGFAGSEDRLDAAVDDQQLAVGEHLARVDVEDPGPVNDDDIGHGGRCYRPPTL